MLSKKGQLIGVHDLLIAATAIVHNCAVLTANMKEFERVPGLETISFLEKQGKENGTSSL